MTEKMNVWYVWGPISLDPTMHETADILALKAKALADEIIRLTPATRESALALTRLEEAMMWAARACLYIGMPKDAAADSKDTDGEKRND